MRLLCLTLARTLVLASTMFVVHAFGQSDVLERSYDRFRTGVNTSETVLKPANVSSTANQFHKRFVMKVDGKVEGSPLYAGGVMIAGGLHNVLYVATMHNTVFAFDGDTGAQLSTRQVDTPVTGYDIGTVKPATIHREWGIASAPVIDRSTGTIYLVRWGYENGTSGPTFRLFGLDMTDLTKEKFLSKSIDSYNVGGRGFDRYRQIQRAGLTLAAKPDGSKAIVIAFTGQENVGGSAGWVVAFDTAKLSGTEAPAVWCSSPGQVNRPGGGAGVWMANAAPAIDDNGDIFVVTGNGPYAPSFGADQLGESVVRLVWTPGSPATLRVADWFTPFVDSDRDADHQDQDLAAGGVLEMPDEGGLIVGGKDGVYYHVNRADMGRRDFSKLIEPPFVAGFDYQPANGHTSLFDDLNQVTSADPFKIGRVDTGRTPHLHGGAVYFNGTLFVQSENEQVRAFTKTAGKFGATPSARGTVTASRGTAPPGGMAGGILSISANNTSDGILWVNEAFGNLASDPYALGAPTPNILRAYDISAVSSGTLQPIWDSEMEPNDHLGAATKFAPPLVANGRIYQATYDNQIVVYGLGGASSTPKRDIQRTVVFIYAKTDPGQDLFVRGGSKGGAPIRISHRNWLNPKTNTYRWGDAYLDWGAGEVGQAQPNGIGGGSPAEWTTSVVQGAGQPYVTMAGYGIADENTFGPHYWMLDIDMDCEQAIDDGHGQKWFELKAVIAALPGWEGDIAQNSSPMPPYASTNHMGICGRVNVFVANYPNLPAGLNPNSAQFLAPTYTYATPVDERTASPEVLNNTPCTDPGKEMRCVGSVLQVCKSLPTGNFFQTVQDCRTVSAGGNFVQMCKSSTGACCSPINGDRCQ
jgi:outer membrane protein assembly factor BamB